MNIWGRVKRRCVYISRYTHMLVRIIGRPQERKYMFNWMESLQRKHAHYLLDHSMPFICYTAWEYICSTLPKDINVFEYGSGGSTLFWLEKMNARCVSIEHDPRWYDLVQDRVTQLNLSDRFDYRLIRPDLTPHSGGQNPDPFSPSAYWDEKFPANFEQYVKQIDQFSDGYFDVVVVDGRSRPACIAHAVSKVRDGGLLIVDNSDRPYFTYLRQSLADFEEQQFAGLVPTSLDLSQTSVFIRCNAPNSAPNNDIFTLKSHRA